MDKPIIRAVEAFPLEHDGQTSICLRDATGLAPEPIMLGMGAYFIITLFDGTNELRDIQTAFTRRFGQILPLDRLNELIEALDRAYFLDSPAFRERVRQVRDEFRASPLRAAAHAGLCYPEAADAVRGEIEGYFKLEDGPGTIAPQKHDNSLAGLIAPHIDPRRGAAAYAHAYGELKAHKPPELVIILGTSHYGGGPELFTSTLKDYDTPLGAVPTDRGFVERLSARYRGGDLFAEELLHRNEHSIEFQALFLRWALGEHEFSVVPVLVSSFHEMVAKGIKPAQDARVGSFIEALRGELDADGRTTMVIAGVDFAHVGQKFGDEFAVDEAIAERVRQEDLALIDFITRGDAEGFFEDIARDRDARRICGLAPMYTQLELLNGRSGRLLKYGIAMEPDTGSAVSFASLAID